MNEEQAKAIAKVFGGRTWQSGGEIWLVLIDKKDGKLVVISDEVICEYSNQMDFDNNKLHNSILLHV